MTERTPSTAGSSDKWYSPNVRRVLLILGALAVLFAPIIGTSHTNELLVEILLLFILAMALDLLMGYMDYVSFGHSAFFGFSAYATGLVMLHVTQMTIPGVLIGVIATAIIAIPIGYFCLIRKGIYFAMLTLAFSQLLYVAAFVDIFGLTGGANGLRAISRGVIGIPGVYEFVPTSVHMYYLTALIAIIVYVLLKRIVNSPFGSVVQAIGENEERVQYAGYNVHRYKITTFVISGTFGGIAGALYPVFYGATAPEVLFWLVSGEAVVIVLLGGMGTLSGAGIGAAIFVVMRELVSPYLREWYIVLGVVFVLVAMFLPNGVISLLDVAREKISKRFTDR